MYQSTEVFDRAYSSVKGKEGASQQTHLNNEEQADLERVLAKYSTTFDGKLGCYPQNRIKCSTNTEEAPISNTILARTCLCQGDGGDV